MEVVEVEPRMPARFVCDESKMNGRVNAPVAD